MTTSLLSRVSSGFRPFALFCPAVLLLLWPAKGRAGEVNAPAYWAGGTNGSWETSGNWKTSAAGNQAFGTVPNGGTDVFFYTTTPAAHNLSTTLDGFISIHSLTFTSSATQSVTIAPGTSAPPPSPPPSLGPSIASVIEAVPPVLTIGGGGITVQNSSGAHTISAPITFGTPQTWTVGPATGTNTAGILTISGAVTDQGNGPTITKAGTGTLLLTGANTYIGNTNVNAGTLQIGNGTSGSILGKATVTTATGATLVLDQADATTFFNPVSNSGSVHTIQSGTTTLSGDISGSGSLVQSGTGTTILTGANTFTGGTTVDHGTLQINGTYPTPTLVGTVAVNNGATLLSTQRDGFGTSGSAATSVVTLNIVGGTVTHTASNLTLANVTINMTGGTLQSQGAGTSLDFFGGSTALNTLATSTTATLGGTVNLRENQPSTTFTVGRGTTASGVDLLVSAVIQQTQAPSALVKAGAGTMVLTGANTYTGTTSVNAGTLQVGDGTSGSISPGSAVSVAGGAKLAINLADENTFGSSINNSGTVSAISSNLNTITGSITGTGAFVQDGTGTTILSGKNDYSGTTTINKGTLQAGGGGGLSANSDFLVNRGATLDLNGFSNVIGALSNGANGGGTVTGGDGFTSTGGGSNSHVLVTTQTVTLGGTDNDGSFSGVIQDGSVPLSLSKIGAGTQVLGGHNTYTGPTRVVGGVLIINGSITSDVTVGGEGGLGGSGTIFGSVTNNGSMSPGFLSLQLTRTGVSGNQVGTLTIHGNFTQSTDSEILFQFASPTSFDRLVITGSASLGGVLDLATLNGFSGKVGEIFKIISAAGGITGSFDTIHQAPSLLVLKVVQTADGVYLEAFQNSFSQAFGLNQPFKFIGLTPNQTAVARDLDRALFDKREAAVISFLDSIPFNRVPHDLDRIAAEEFASFFSLGFAQMDSHYLALEQRFADLRATANHDGQGDADKTDAAKNPAASPATEDRWGFFITATGGFSDSGTTYNAPGYDTRSGGTALGVDIRLDQHTAFGLTLGYAHANTDLNEGGRITTDGGRAGVYGVYDKDSFFFEGYAGGGYNSYDNHRAALNGFAVSSTEGGEFDAACTFGYNIKKGGLTITPLASLLYTFVGIDGFTETGSFNPLHVDSQSESSLRSRVGVKVSYTTPVASYTLTPYASAMWQHEYRNDQLAIDSNFANGAGSLFTVHGPEIGRDSLLLTTGVSVAKGDYAVYLAYQAEVGRSNYSNQSVLLGLRVAW